MTALGPAVLVLVKYPPLLVSGKYSVHLPLPVLALQDGPRLGVIVIVELHGVGKCTDQLPVALDELHVPAAPDDVVQAELILPAKLHPKEPVPLWRGEFLSVGNGHALEQFGQGYVYHQGVALLQVRHRACVQQVHQGPGSR